jgi:glutamate/tyrosine decarboxylase-like PLP-dependent enzyme
VAELVERCCAHARRFADGVARIPSAQVLNDVVLNQVLVRFSDDDDTTREVIRGMRSDARGGTAKRSIDRGSRRARAPEQHS